MLIVVGDVNAVDVMDFVVDVDMLADGDMRY